VAVAISAAALERERPNLERGSVVADGVTGLARGAFCDLDLVFPSGGRMTVPARAVLTSEASTVFAFDDHDRAALGRLLSAPAVAPAAPTPAAPGTAATPPEPPDEPAPGADEPSPATVQERLRGLSVVEQLRVARDGGVTERVVLERLYGKVVWEALLRNTRVTVPEVARLAKMGTMPRPLLELIVGTPAWLQVPQIRRALLSNPRLTADMVQRVLALLPRDELKLVPQATAYPAAVRMAAKAMVKG
jgi:hypothetical protein